MDAITAGQPQATGAVQDFNLQTVSFWRATEGVAEPHATMRRPKGDVGPKVWLPEFYCRRAPPTPIRRSVRHMPTPEPTALLARPRTITKSTDERPKALIAVTYLYSLLSRSASLRASTLIAETRPISTTPHTAITTASKRAEKCLGVKSPYPMVSPVTNAK